MDTTEQTEINANDTEGRVAAEGLLRQIGLEVRADSDNDGLNNVSASRDYDDVAGTAKRDAQRVSDDAANTSRVSHERGNRTQLVYYR